MTYFKTAQEWIDRCDLIEDYRYEEALIELRDSMNKENQCTYSSDEIAEYLIKWEGGLETIYKVLSLIDLCYDKTWYELRE